VKQKQTYIVTFTAGDSAEIKDINLSFAKAQAQRLYGSRVVSVKASS
jgi:hypothetical protein